jgi:hypothetical protein
MTVSDFRSLLRDELDARGLLGTRESREACAARAAELGATALAEVEALVGAATARRALSIRRGEGFAASYRYVMGYGALMTEFLVAPARPEPSDRQQIAALGAVANLIVSHFDELVDGGWPRSLLLPSWALVAAPTYVGRTVLRAAARAGPAPTRVIVTLVANYFERVRALERTVARPRVRRRLSRTIMTMYSEEGRTPREWRRIRGDAALQKKTALPLVVLGLPVWLVSADFDAARFEAHYRWLVHVGKFVRWVDDAADAEADGATGASNLVRHALAERTGDAAEQVALAAAIARRGRRLVDQWHAFVAAATDENSRSAISDDHVPAVLSNVLAAWVGEPEYASPR